jgi:hypothetical protein
MNLIPEWGKVVRKAWSMRLMVLAGALSGAEIILPFFSDALPRGLFAALSFVAVSGAFIARMVAQKDFNGPHQ